MELDGRDKNPITPAGTKLRQVVESELSGATVTPTSGEICNVIEKDVLFNHYEGEEEIIPREPALVWSEVDSTDKSKL